MLSYHTCPLAAPGGKETGGMNVYVRELMRQLGRRGHLVDCFTRSQSQLVPHIPDTDLGPNVRVIHVAAGREAPLGKEGAWDVVEAFISGVKAFIGAEGIHYDLYHSHYWMSGYVARRLQARWPAPIVHMFHTLGAMKDQSRGEGGAPEIGPRRGVEQDIFDTADAIVAATPVDRRHMLEWYRADGDRIVTVPPGVDLSRFRPLGRATARRALSLPEDHAMVLFVGRPDPVKGLDTLLRAMALLTARDPGLRTRSCLCVIGGDKDGESRGRDAEMARIDALREALGLGDFVAFMGPQDQDALVDYYNAAQVVVVPSRYESFGMVALEAMACGVPVIASDVGGLSTLVREGRTGFLVPFGDPAALADALWPILDDDAMRDALGAQGAAVAEGYGWPAIAGRIERLYERLWAGQPLLLA
ncbi:MAG: glycosyltransferase [Ardenticatenia bacterium]|nr:glycosyltransferase [Ardenticatenia bacterium]